MSQQTNRKIILITRKTRLDDLIIRFNTVEQAKFYVEQSGADFGDYLTEHRNYEKALKSATRTLGSFGRVQVLDRYFLPNFIFGREDTVVVLGQDGLVANTLKYLTGQMVIGTNPDPARWDGILLPFTVEDLTRVVPETFAGSRPIQEVSMAKAELNDGQVLHAVNDLFIGPKSHTSMRYVIEHGGTREQQSSSGVIVSTGLGSTGWLKSLVTGAKAIVQSLAGKVVPTVDPTGFAWEANRLYYTVREPFPSKTSSAQMVFGTIEDEQKLTIESLMPEDGIVFSDGIESDFLTFNSGTWAVISVAEKKGMMVL